MKKIMLVCVVISLAIVLGSTLGLPQQSGSTNISGGRGGSPFSDPQPAAGTRVTEIRIRSGETIDAIQMVYASATGSSALASQHGGSGGRLNVFRLDADEYITGISGRYGEMVDSLRIHTNKKTSPLYGGSGGSGDYQIEVPNGTEALGFTGRSGERVDAIGLTYAPLNLRLGGALGGQTITGQYAQPQIFGGSGGYPFWAQDIPSGARIAEIRISANDRVESVQTVYALADGRTVEGTRHGGSGGRQRIFRLDSDEYITGISGRYGVFIYSLQIQTNKKTSPLYGGPGGIDTFQIEVPSGSRAVGFAGRSSAVVDAIGLTCTPQSQTPGAGTLGQVMTDQYPQTQLYGGNGGYPFSAQDIPSGARIAGIRISASDRVDSVQMIYDLPDGSTVEGTRYGGSGGRQRIFRLDSDEYITGISGRYSTVVHSLQIRTNKKTSPLYGGSAGSNAFQIEIPSGSQAVGFAGRASAFVDAIGLTYSSPALRAGGRYGGRQVARAGTAVQYQQTPLYGGSGGNPFSAQDIPSGARIAEIRISASDRVDSVQMIYDLPDGGIVEGQRYGGSGGRLRVFRLDSDEYITGISGRYSTVIQSLQIQTNKKTSPLYGGSGGSRSYQIDVPSGSRAVGFTGRAGQYLDAIGLTHTRIDIRR